MLRFKEIIYGPVHSRRLGVSLGVNLLPIDAKICTFNCVYCECGFNTTMQENPMPTREETYEALEYQLSKMQQDGTLPDVITFAGNGEPTLHPRFEGIIDDTISLRDKYCPNAKVSVLTNSTRIDKPQVFRALCKVDNNILKLDSAFDSTLRLLDQPVSDRFNIAWLKEQIKRFEGRFIIQTMFISGVHNGMNFDNTTDREVDAWLLVLEEIGASQIMIYTLDREAPVKSLRKISLEKLNQIANKARNRGFSVSVSG